MHEIWEWVKSVAVVIAIVLASIGAVLGGISYGLAKDARQVQSETAAVDRCREDLSTVVDNLEGRVNTESWKIVLHYFRGDPAAEIEEQSANVKLIIEEWEIAVDRREDADAICTFDEEARGRLGVSR